jgi:hypothetical protein
MRQNIYIESVYADALKAVSAIMDRWRRRCRLAGYILRRKDAGPWARICLFNQ